MIYRNCGSSSDRVSGDVKLLRRPPRPVALRQDGYEERFDYSTIWYDCLQHSSDDSVVLLGPPMLNLAGALSQGIFQAGGDEIRSVKVRKRSRVLPILIPLKEAIEETEFDCDPYSMNLKVQKNQTEMFVDRLDLLTVS